jgi:hypothetical protein
MDASHIAVHRSVTRVTLRRKRTRFLVGCHCTSQEKAEDVEREKGNS